MKKLTFLLCSLTFLMFGFLHAQTIMPGGHINQNTTWNLAGSPYLVQDDIIIDQGVTLTIEPGVVVKFNDWYDGFVVSGSLKAIGTASDSIVFTSLEDDYHGGDNNGDGSTTSPAPDQWSTIEYQPGSSGVLKYCFVGYGGGEYSANIHANDNDVSIEHCTVAYSKERGIYVGDASPDINDNIIKNNIQSGVRIEGLDSLKTLSMSNNVFSNNQWAVVAWLKDETADITLINNSSTGSDPNGFGRNGFGIWGSIAGNNIYTGQKNFPFILWDDVTINKDAALTLTPGTTVKFNDWYDGFTIYGSLKAVGTKTDSIAFTSLYDDSHGGDTNADTVSAAPDQWSTIDYEPSSSGALKYCFVGYGGGEYSANIHANDNDVSIEHCTVAYSKERGIYVEDASPDIQYNTISSNNTDGIFTTGGALPNLQNNNIINNINYGVYNADATVDVDARNNWWGDASGPYHKDHNPNGKGNSASDHVLFQPWLENPVDVNTAVEEYTEESLIENIYPNPAGSLTQLTYKVKKAGKVLISIYDLNGKTILPLVNSYQSPGKYTVHFNGNILSHGLYLIGYKNPEGFQTQKFVK